MKKSEQDLIGEVMLADGRVIDLSCSVKEVLEVQGLVVVRIEPRVGEIFNRNVIALDEGKVLWQIEESPHGTQPDKPFTSITVSKDGRLTAGNWNGVDYTVSVADGKIQVKSFSR